MNSIKYVLNDMLEFELSFLKNLKKELNSMIERREDTYLELFKYINSLIKKPNFHEELKEEFGDFTEKDGILEFENITVNLNSGAKLLVIKNNLDTLRDLRDTL